jgi:hypothetical protein
MRSYHGMCESDSKAKGEGCEMTAEGVLPLLCLVFWTLLGTVVGFRIRSSGERRGGMAVMKMSFMAVGWFASLFALEIVLKKGSVLGAIGLIVAHLITALVVIAWPHFTRKT